MGFRVIDSSAELGELDDPDDKQRDSGVNLSHWR